MEHSARSGVQRLLSFQGHVLGNGLAKHYRCAGCGARLGHGVAGANATRRHGCGAPDVRVDAETMRALDLECAVAKVRRRCPGLACRAALAPPQDSAAPSSAQAHQGAALSPARPDLL